MPIYAVLDSSKILKEGIERIFQDSDRCQVSSTSWFVKSTKVTSAEVSRDLGITTDGALTGVVIKTIDYSGVASTEIVEKLSIWEQQS